MVLTKQINNLLAIYNDRLEGVLQILNDAKIENNNVQEQIYESLGSVINEFIEELNSLNDIKIENISYPDIVNEAHSRYPKPENGWKDEFFIKGAMWMMENKLQNQSKLINEIKSLPRFFVSSHEGTCIGNIEYSKEGDCVDADDLLEIIKKYE